ncbi:hypothetical protein [Cellvibrio sp. KY-YJ-3]|uniref:hypothetical protein n=1 Tax=Cellvibrio sp. KY-YJ-3 TaxID=454662 RepID=UPI001247E9CF|nr:hypothetical protein [Cellvibrio sp. KY-YJ-3]QEY12892.1 hypothetical protein D0B88_11885 [Cellvibrio sp. KY-YJ-3]
MNYFNLPSISKEIIKRAAISNIVCVPIEPQIGSLPLSCLKNVKSYVEINGGNIQFGWIFSCLGNVVLKKTAHAVVARDDKSLLCVTPNEYKLDNLNFSPDNSIEGLIKNTFLPTHFVALVQNRSLENFLSLERELDQLRLNNIGIVSSVDVREIERRAAVLYPEILDLAKKHTGGYDYCYCGSGRKRKNCCR